MRIGASTNRREQSYFVALVKWGVELGVLVVDGHGDVLPEWQVVGAAVMKDREQVGDGGGIGKFNDVAIAVEEILEDTEVEHVDSHMGMVSTSRGKGLRRWAAIGVSICHLPL